MKIFRPLFIATLVLLAPGRPVLAQSSDPKAAFVESLGLFSAAPDRASLDQVARALSEWDAAVRRSEAQFVASLPGSPTPVAARMHVALGAAYLNRRRIQDALREFEAGSHLDPARAEVFTFQGIAHDQVVGDFDRAATAYRQAAALDPLNPSRAYLLARALDKSGKHDQAIDAYRRVRQLWTRDVREHTPIPIAAPFIQLSLVEERPGVEPFFPPARLAEGFELLRRSDYAAAIESFKRAIDSPEPSALSPASALTPDDESGTVHYRRARLYHRQNKTVEALAEYEAAEKAKPFVGAGRLLQTIGGLQAAQQNFEAALRAYSARVDLSLNDAGAHRTLGYLYSRLERHDEAFAEFAIALTIAPDQSDLHVAMSQMSLKDGDFTAAADEARRAIAVNPANKQAHYSLGTALMRLDKVDDARPEFDAFERLQAQDTADASRRMTVNGLRRQASAHLAKEEYALAEAALRKAIELAPDDSDVREELADVEASASATTSADKQPGAGR